MLFRKHWKIQQNHHYQRATSANNHRRKKNVQSDELRTPLSPTSPFALTSSPLSTAFMSPMSTPMSPMSPVTHSKLRQPP